MVNERKTNTKSRDYYDQYNRGSYSRGSAARNQNSYYSGRGYSRNNYFQNRWERPRERPFPRPSSRPISRPLSPVEGSEEFMARKIQHTSAIIMRQLLNSNEPITSSSKAINEDKKIQEISNEAIQQRENKEKQNEKSSSKSRKIGTNEINVKEIHDKIINRISNLNEGRKKNFINAHNNTSLDNAIQHIHKQKRLELSRVLRDMCSSSQNLEKSGELINSIIPDIGIKLEELPIEVIQELRQTLNLDLDEDMLDTPLINIPISYDELDAAVESIKVKTEPVDCCSGVAVDCSETVEIKPEDIVDLEGLGENTQSNWEETIASPTKETVQETEKKAEEVMDSIHYSVVIKEETQEELMRINDQEDCVSLPRTFTQSTVPFPGNHTDRFEPGIDQHICNGDLSVLLPIETGTDRTQCDNYTTSTIHYENASSQTDNSLSSYENFLTRFFENDEEVLDLADCNKVSKRIELVDQCVKYLSEYRLKLVKSVLDHCYRNKNREGIGITQKEISHNRASQTESPVEERFVTSEDEDNRVTKRRKVENGTQDQMNQKDSQIEIDVEYEQKFLTFQKLPEQVMVIEKVDNQLIIATKAGNIIYASLKDGTFLKRVDISASPISSLLFHRGINELVSMYVGSLDHVLRIYDFQSGTISKATRVDDQIRCMDAMWDYIFMGCSGGTLIRYSTKKEKIEFEEKNTGTDILVIKAAQEGPRRVILVGHKQAPVYVRDAMSGLYLRNFSNEAITPTVYALIVNNNFLYCGTAKNNILVFSFHDGHLLHKLIAADCKGISCMKIYKDLLFAGCYNGSIYLYNLKIRKLILILNGPGGSISCMEVLHNQVIVGTRTGEFGSVAIPEEVYR